MKGEPDTTVFYRSDRGVKLYPFIHWTYLISFQVSITDTHIV